MLSFLFLIYYFLFSKQCAFIIFFLKYGTKFSSFDTGNIVCSGYWIWNSRLVKILVRELSSCWTYVGLRTFFNNKVNQLFRIRLFLLLLPFKTISWNFTFKVHQVNFIVIAYAGGSSLFRFFWSFIQLVTSFLGTVYKCYS